MASHTSSPLNSLRFPSIAKSRSIQGLNDPEIVYKRTPHQDPVDYPADGRDADNEEEENKEEDEHLALADSNTLPVIDHVPSAEDTKAFKTDETIQKLEGMLRAFVIDFRNGWDNHLPLVEFSTDNS
nr:putative reverse transcriptase domain-containing protein [Tanacetum cinerariifolium]